MKRVALATDAQSVALGLGHQVVGEAVHAGELQAQQDVAHQAHHGGQERYAQAGGEVAQQVLRLAGVKALNLTDLHGQDRETNHLAQQAELELHTIHPPSGGVWAVGFVHQQVQWCATVLRVGRQCVPVFTNPAFAFEHALQAMRHSTLQLVALVGEFFGAHTTPQSGNCEHDDDDQGDACGVGADQQMPNTFDAQEPGGEDEQTQQHQPLKPEGLHVPMRVGGFEACEKRLQDKPPVKS